MTQYIETIKRCFFLFNIRPVLITVKDQLSIGDNFFMKGDKAKILYYVAKAYRSKGLCEIDEYQKLDFIFSDAITNQLLQKFNLVKIRRDFYFLVNDYFKIISNKLRRQKIKQLKAFYEHRKKIICNFATAIYNPTVVQRMSYEEYIMYMNIQKHYSLIEGHLQPLLSSDKEDEL